MCSDRLRSHQGAALNGHASRVDIPRHRDWACPLPTSAPGPGSSRPHLHRDWVPFERTHRAPISEASVHSADGAPSGRIAYLPPTHSHVPPEYSIVPFKPSGAPACHFARMRAHRGPWPLARRAVRCTARRVPTRYGARCCTGPHAPSVASARHGHPTPSAALRRREAAAALSRARAHPFPLESSDQCTPSANEDSAWFDTNTTSTSESAQTAAAAPPPAAERTGSHAARAEPMSQ